MPGQITRTFLSPPMRGVHALVRGWMEAAGMQTTVDAAGNLRGLSFPFDSTQALDEHEPERSEGSAPTRPKTSRILLGSHLDTVPNAGAFDGILGVVLAVEVVEQFRHDPANATTPLAIEVIGFSEEEGVRFRKPFLGSLAVIGALDAATLALTDSNGVTVGQAIRDYGLDPARLPEATLAPDTAAYLEVHIEQGPVLESLAHSEQEQIPSPAWTHDRTHPRPLGIVTAIAGQTRLLITFTGQANHAGTTPMHLRRDPLAAAAEWMVSVERHARQQPGLVATVGSLAVEPGASNVIPGMVRATLDVRHADDFIRATAVDQLLHHAAASAQARGVRLTHEITLDQPAVPMDARLQSLLREAATRAGHTPHPMLSGAGHDAMILAPHLPAAMLFVASPGGLSHHPDESVLATDLQAATKTMLEFLHSFGDDETPAHG